MQGTQSGPFGIRRTEGIVHRRSPHTVGDTVERLTDAIHGAGAELFLVVDHSGEAHRAGLSLRDTKLLIFGNPVAGTPLMEAAPLVAIDLPLKVLVWADDAGAVWMTHLSPEWLADRGGLSLDQPGALSAPEVLTGRVAEGP
jgi:uncharacterized protein (DUF302 family)